MRRKAQLRRRTVGYVFQDFNLLPGLTAGENVSLPLELDGTSARRARVAALKALDGLGLGNRAGHFPDQLSGGERQRVAIARAMIGERKLLLADEPSGALDSANGDAVMRLLHGACKDTGMTAIVVTHDAQLAAWADRVIFIRDGRITDQTTPAAGPGVPARAGRHGAGVNEHRDAGQARQQAAAARPAAPSSAGRSACCATSGGSSC